MPAPDFRGYAPSARERYLLELIDRAMALAEQHQARAQEAEVKLATLQAIEERLGRIETYVIPAPLNISAKIRKQVIDVLKDGKPHTAAGVVRVLYPGQEPHPERRKRVWMVLKRLSRQKQCTFNGETREYTLVNGGDDGESGS